MARVERRPRVLTRAALALGFLFLGCGQELGPAGPWIPWDKVAGALRPELASAPWPLASAPGQRLRIVTYNVHYGQDVEALAEAFTGRAELFGADVVLLQEIQSYPDENGSRAGRLAARLGMGYAYAPAKTIRNGTHGLAILSRLPLEDVEVMQLPSAKIAFGTERRIALAAEVRAGAGRVRIVDIHLDTRLNVAQRIEQLRPAVLGYEGPMVVGGDFNTNPFVWSGRTVPDVPLHAVADSDQAPIVDDYMRAIGFGSPTAGLGPTAPFPLLEVRLDSIYTRSVDSGAGAVERSVDVSDHWPVWLDVVAP